MRALVTGAAGFIGTHIAHTLADQGHDIIGIDIREAESYPGVTSVAADIRDAGAVATAMRGVDVVFHQAAVASVPASFADPAECMSVNVAGSATVFEQARLAGVGRVVMASTSAVYGDDPTPVKHEELDPVPLSPYAVSKLSMEYLAAVYARQYGMSMVALRYFNVFGPGQPAEGGYAAVIPAILRSIHTRQPMRVYGDGEQTRSFVYVSDVVRANQLAAQVQLPEDMPLLVANISHPETVSLNRLVELVGIAAGSLVETINEPEREGDIKHSAGDGSLAMQELGFTPSYSLQDGIRELMTAGE